jgi:hypothetical protein
MRMRKNDANQFLNENGAIPEGVAQSVRGFFESYVTLKRALDERGRNAFRTQRKLRKLCWEISHALQMPFADVRECMENIFKAI